METVRSVRLGGVVGALVILIASGSQAAPPRKTPPDSDHLTRFAAGRAAARAATPSPLGGPGDALTPLHHPDDQNHPDEDDLHARTALPPGGAEGGVFSAWNVNLLSHLPVSEISSSSTAANDIWGYVSPAGREYAVVGLNLSTGFVDVTDPVNPLVVADIGDAASTWSDMRTYRGYAYNVNETGGGVQVIDLTQIDDGVVTLVGSAAGGMQTAHNISLNPVSGFAYPCGTDQARGFIAFDLADPRNPQPVGSWSNTYVHDLQVVSYDSCPYSGRVGQPCELAYAFCGGAGMKILDVTNKSAIVLISTLTYPTLAYCHQGWLSEDRRYVLMDDESDELSFNLPTTTYVVNVENPSAPFLVTTYNTGLNSIDHNLMIRGQYVFQADYTTGLQVFDISNVLNAQKVGFFDTFPPNDARVFSGAWGVYSDLPSGIILISDIEGGLFVLDASPAVGCQQDSHCNDRNPCTIDECNASGQCEYTNVSTGTACDDDDVCTTAGVCDGAGACLVTDINTIPCANDTVCAPGTCNLVTGFCECGCTAVARPLAEAVVVPRVRYLSVTPDNPGVQTALRVTFSDLPAPFGGFSGTQMWVGSPFPVSESPGVAGPTPPTFVAARLSCEAFFTDWGSVDTVQVFGEGIVPGGTYDVQAIGKSCYDVGVPRYSTARTVRTSRWGDLVGNCTVVPCTPPDGVVNVTTDIVGMLDKFGGRAGAPVKARADLEPSLPDFIISIADVVQGLDAFRGEPYPFAGPSPCQ